MNDRSTSKPADDVEQSLSNRETMAPTNLSDSTPTSSGPFAQLPVEFGRFRVLKLLGHGAMGTVYLAFDPELTKEVALKIPKADLAQDAVLWERFQREARAVGDLNHVNICGMYEVGQIGATHYISMEYIDGRPLSDFISAELPQRKVVGVVRKLAAGLAHAHERGIVHRDLKPDNVMIDAKGEPKLMDFGLARRLDTPSDVRATQSGMIVGSPAYMSPEQARAEHDKIGPRTDVYGLGVLFFEMLTGSLPFRGQMVVVLGQIATQLPPRPTSLRADVDPKLETLCLKMLAKKQQDRPQSMTEVVTILTDWSKSNSPSAASSDPNVMTIAKEEPLVPVKPAAARAEKTNPVEAQKQRVNDLLSKHQYAAAIDLLDKIVNLKDARFEKLVAWARERLPEVRATEQKMREASAPLCATGEKLLMRHDYTEAVTVLSSIPVQYRSAELREMLGQATDLKEECEQLEQDIADAIQQGDADTLPALVKRLLKLKPASKAIKQLAEDLKKFGAKKVIALRKGQRRFLDTNERLFEPKQIVAAVAGIAALFAAVYFGVVMYLQTPGGTLVVDVEGNGLAVVVSEDGVSVRDGKKEFRIKTTDQRTLAVEHEGTTVEGSSRVVKLNRGEKRTVTVRLVDGKVQLTENGEKFVFKAPIKPGPGPTTPTASEDRTVIMNRLKQIGLALHRYHDTNGKFPPAVNSNSPNRTAVSWRLWILPYLDQATTYNQINFQESWDSAKNKPILASLPTAFDSPILTSAQRTLGRTVFLAPVAQGTVLGHESGTTLPSITDGTSNTILVVAARASESKVWASPDELQIDMNDPLKGLTGQPGGEFAVLMGDGSVKWIPDSIDAETFRSLLKMNDGQGIDWNRIEALRSQGVKSKVPNEASDGLNAQPGAPTAGDRMVLDVQGIKYAFRWCPPGTFTMGSLGSEPGRGMDEDQVTVELTNGYWILETEVTQSMWAALMNSHPWQAQRLVREGANYPATYVSHGDAIAFCEKLTKLARQANVLGAVDHISLPTEAQWEYACRAGTTTRYSFGSDPSQLNRFAWYGLNVSDITENHAHEVGTKLANPWGLSDIHGNVWEWCADWYGYKMTGGRDPEGAPNGSERIYRGGAWNINTADRLRSAWRSKIAPKFAFHYLGFRVVLPSQPAPAAASVPPNFPQTIASQSNGMKLTLIPAGTFMMGSPVTESERYEREGPQHSVRISRPYYMGVSEVTQSQYEQVMGATPSWFSKNGMGRRQVSDQDTSQFPVEGVSWFDAVEFCNQLSTKDGLASYYTLTNVQRESGSIKSATVSDVSRAASAPGRGGYRLPTEAEWEYACRADTTTTFHFGNILNGDKANVPGNSPYGTTTKGKTLGRTTTVGAYGSNQFGLFDMHGNVWEWCDDVFEERAYSKRSGTTLDPRVMSGSANRVWRGGSWGDVAGFARAAVRNWVTPDCRSYGIGFRVVR